MPVSGAVLEKNKILRLKMNRSEFVFNSLWKIAQRKLKETCNIFENLVNENFSCYKNSAQEH